MWLEIGPPKKKKKKSHIPSNYHQLDKKGQADTSLKPLCLEPVKDNFIGRNIQVFEAA